MKPLAFVLRLFTAITGRRRERQGATPGRPTSTEIRLFLISLVSFNLVSTILILGIYTSVKTRLQSESRNTYSSIVHQATREIETFIHTSLFYLGSLSMDEQLQDLLRAPAAVQLQDRLRLLRVQQALKRLKVHDRDIQSVYFFKFSPQLVVSDRGIYPDSTSFGDRELFQQLAGTKVASFARYDLLQRAVASHYTGVEADSVEVLTLILPMNMPDLRGALVLNLRTSWFQNLFTRTLGSLAGSTYLYMPDGALITSTNDPPAGLTPPPAAATAARFGVKQGMLDGTRSLIFFGAGQYGLTLIHTVERRVVYKSAFVVRNTLVGLWIAVFLVSLPFALRIRQLAHRPIERLYSFLRNNQYIPADSSVRSEVGLLMQTYQRLADTNLIYRRQLSGYRPLFDELLLMNILSGKSDPILPSSNYRRTFLSTFTQPFYVCFILEIDDFPQYSRTRPIDKRSEDSALILRTIEKGFPGARAVSHILEDRIVVVCPLDDPDRANLEVALAGISKTIAEGLEYSVSIALGECVRKITDLPRAYQSAESIMEQKFISGKGRILNYHDLPQEQHNENSIKDSLKLLQSSVRSLHYKKAEEYLDGVLCMVTPRHHVKETFAVVSTKILSALASISEEKQLEVPGSEELSEVVQNSETLTDLRDWFRVVLKNFFQQVELLKREKNIDYLERVRALIDQWYMNPMLQISDIAEQFHLSPTYFGRFFNETTGKSFTTYVNDVRLDHAAEFLKSTDYSVNDIAEKVGFNSTQYFIRVFKKKYKCTPGNYKVQGLREQKSGLPAGEPTAVSASDGAGGDLHGETQADPER